MIKTEIVEKLQIEFDKVEKLLNELSENQIFQRPINNKWSVAENILHLILTTKPLVGLFGKPEIMFSNWGKSNRISRKYSIVIELYLKHIGNPGFTNKDYTPSKVDITKSELTQNFQSINLKFLERTVLLEEDDLDNYQIPHPLIGLLTCREFLYFSHYHTIHHFNTIKNILEMN